VQPPPYPNNENWPQQPNSQYPNYENWQPSQQPNSQYPNYENWPQQPNMYYQPQQPEQWQQPPPMPPFQQPPKKKSKLPLILAIVGGVLILACVGAFVLVSAAARSITTSTVPTLSTAIANSTAHTSNQQSSQHFKVGDVVKVGETWNITINSVKTSNGSSQFYTPKSGHEYLILNITARNISSQEQVISSLVLFSLTDASGQKYDETIDPDAGATLDGKVEASSQLKGSIVYEVPNNIHSYQLAFEASIVSSGQTIWDINA